ncbi:hypothetical protein pdam_00021317 [Pocillopora damicornis]|uniref:Uncharacterized protein n=1 Tax=Pocillopora damicornis TaxID=46731 RepID=A0A3M6V3E4_POCDA|nr:hypothetical protein pdam_00021317 [Pocillopora damicornis]
MTVRRITNLIWELKGQQKFDCRTKNNQPQQRWQRQGVVDKPWLPQLQVGQMSPSPSNPIKDLITTRLNIQIHIIPHPFPHQKKKPNVKYVFSVSLTLRQSLDQSI